MRLRICAAQDRGVRNHGSGRLRIGALEDQGLLGQLVQDRCQSTVSAQKTHAVGAHGVEGDQNDGRVIGGAGEGGEQAHAEREKDQSPSQHSLQSICYAL